MGRDANKESFLCRVAVHVIQGADGLRLIALSGGWCLFTFISCNNSGLQ